MQKVMLTFKLVTIKLHYDDIVIFCPGPFFSENIFESLPGGKK